MNLTKIDVSFADYRDFLGEFAPRICEEGLFLPTLEKVPRGSRVLFTFKLKGDEAILLRGKGRVEFLGDEEAPGLGIRFEETEDHTHELIRRLMQRQEVSGRELFHLAPPEDPSADEWLSQLPNEISNGESDQVASERVPNPVESTALLDDSLEEAPVDPPPSPTRPQGRIQRLAQFPLSLVSLVLLVLLVITLVAWGGDGLPASEPDPGLKSEEVEVIALAEPKEPEIDVDAALMPDFMPPVEEEKPEEKAGISALQAPRDDFTRLEAIEIHREPFYTEIEVASDGEIPRHRLRKMPVGDDRYLLILKGVKVLPDPAEIEVESDFVRSVRSGLHRRSAGAYDLHVVVDLKEGCGLSRFTQDDRRLTLRFGR